MAPPEIVPFPFDLAALRLEGGTKVVGIFGDPIGHTLSPRMHNYAFAKLGLDYIYVPFHVKPESLAAAVQSIRGLELAGVNVTIPHKEAVLSRLDELSPAAQKIGAVNAIVNRRGRLSGHNTDAPGFLASLKEEGNFDPAGKRALILGAGGTTRAMTVALLEAGIREIAIANRTAARAESLAVQLRALFPGAAVRVAGFSETDLRREARASDLLINATPSGMEESVLPFAVERLITPDIFVFDVVYARSTPLLLAARRAGAPHLGGLDMLIRQGALSFALWTGLEPPVRLMRESLKEIAA